MATVCRTQYRIQNSIGYVSPHASWCKHLCHLKWHLRSMTLEKALNLAEHLHFKLMLTIIRPITFYSSLHNFNCVSLFSHGNALFKQLYLNRSKLANITFPREVKIAIILAITSQSALEMASIYKKKPHFVLEKTWYKKTYKVMSCRATILCNKIEPSPLDCGQLETKSKSWLLCLWFQLSRQNHCLGFDEIVCLNVKKYRMWKDFICNNGSTNQPWTTTPWSRLISLLLIKAIK